jgi:hypothetical protein
MTPDYSLRILLKIETHLLFIFAKNDIRDESNHLSLSLKHVMKFTHAFIF